MMKVNDTTREAQLREIEKSFNIVTSAWVNHTFGSAKKPDFRKGAEKLLKRLERIDAQ